jgi:surface protein
MVIKYGAAPKRFQSTWDTTQAGSANDTVVLPLVSDGSYNFRIDWGDGKANRDDITVYNQSEVTHQYDDTGIYTIKVVGDITGWQFNNGGDDDKITEISKWGPLRFVSNDTSIFNGCSNLELTATDSLTLSASNGSSMFINSRNIGSNGNMNSWDTSNLTHMNAMFYGAWSFNQPIGSWDVSNVTNMNRAFFSYQGNMTFDQDIGNWDVSSVTDFTETFGGFNSKKQAFNNGGSSSISGWDTSSATTMRNMFDGCTGFNQPIGNWNTSNVTNMSKMFWNNYSFNQDIGNWDVSGVTDMNGMFLASYAFRNGNSASRS